jgi:hypothetical protein
MATKVAKKATSKETTAQMRALFLASWTFPASIGAMMLLSTKNAPTAATTMPMP